MVALRMRVSMSAIGSVITTADPPSPRRFRHAGNLPLVRKLPKTNAAQHEIAEDGPRAPTPRAPGIGPDLELSAGPLLLLDQCLLRHPARFSSSSLFSSPPR
jgi:hypothetical protein